MTRWLVALAPFLLLLACGAPSRDPAPASVPATVGSAGATAAPATTSAPESTGLAVISGGDAPWAPLTCEGTAALDARGWPIVVGEQGQRTGLVPGDASAQRLVLRHWDAAGHVRWSLPLIKRGDHLAAPWPLHRLPGGDVLLVGSFTGVVEAGRWRLATPYPNWPPQHHAFAVRVGPDGAVRWLTRLGAEAIHARVVGTAVHPDGSTSVGVSSTEGDTIVRLGADGREAALVEEGLVGLGRLDDGGMLVARTTRSPSLAGVVERRTASWRLQARFELPGLPIVSAAPAPGMGAWILLSDLAGDRDGYRSLLESKLGVRLADDQRGHLVVRLDRHWTPTAAHQTGHEEGRALLAGPDGGVVLLQAGPFDDRPLPLAFLTTVATWQSVPAGDNAATVALASAATGVQACLDCSDACASEGLCAVNESGRCVAQEPIPAAAPTPVWTALAAAYAPVAASPTRMAPARRAPTAWPRATARWWANIAARQRRAIVTGRRLAPTRAAARSATSPRTRRCGCSSSLVETAWPAAIRIARERRTVGATACAKPGRTAVACSAPPRRRPARRAPPARTRAGAISSTAARRCRQPAR